MTPAVVVRRNGVFEAEHHVAAAAVSAAGEVVVSVGDITRHFLVRSAAKPFQTAISLGTGITLSEPAIAVASASHGGFPAHVAYVRSILAGAGLDETYLQTPPDWPLAPRARDVWVRRGITGPRPILHNCSGKHAAMLAACAKAGWPTESYLDPDHPIQQRFRKLWTEATGEETQGVGVDGCGAPVYTVSVKGLATAFAVLAQDGPYRRIWSAMHRYPALVAYNGSIDARIATATDAAAKIGAEGCIGVGLRNSVGVAAKSWDGSNRGLEGGIIGCLRGLGNAVGSAADQLTPGPPVLGGGKVQGEVTALEVTHR